MVACLPEAEIENKINKRETRTRAPTRARLNRALAVGPGTITIIFCSFFMLTVEGPVKNLSWEHRRYRPWGPAAVCVGWGGSKRTKTCDNEQESFETTFRVWDGSIREKKNKQTITTLIVRRSIEIIGVYDNRRKVFYEGVTPQYLN